MRYYKLVANNNLVSLAININEVQNYSHSSWELTA